VIAIIEAQGPADLLDVIRMHFINSMFVIVDSPSSSSSSSSSFSFSSSPSSSSSSSVHPSHVVVKAGGNPNDQCEPHGPLLNHCIIEGFDEQAKALLNNGANPNTVEKNNGACALASGTDHFLLVFRFVWLGLVFSLAWHFSHFLAITNGSVDVVRVLLEKRANVNAPIMRDQKVSCKELAKYVADKKPGDTNHAAVAKLLGH
jgi:ankyrin repeat protein